jgi:hypothetical protein
MSKRQIPYNNSAATLRFEYPPNWDAQTITGVNIQITDESATDLLAATAATLWTATTLSAAASIGDTTITLTAATLSPGDVLEIAASATGAKERVTVDFYNSSTKVATLARSLTKAHASGTAVKGAFATYDLDTSTVATWPKAKQVLIKWIPAGSDDHEVHELGEVSVSRFSIPDFENRFRALYAREARIVSQRKSEAPFATLHSEAMEYLSVALLARGLLMERIQDVALASPTVLTYARYLVNLDGGDRYTAEQAISLTEHNRQFELLCNLPIWTDDDQDGAKDEKEVDDHGGRGMLMSETAI